MERFSFSWPTEAKKKTGELFCQLGRNKSGYTAKLMLMEDEGHVCHPYRTMLSQKHKPEVQIYLDEKVCKCIFTQMQKVAGALMPVSK